MAGCSLDVAQDVHSGKDKSYRGAKKIKIEEGEGRSRRDVLTYPGGDRVDWKMFELPDGKTGTLKIRLAWKPPRNGLDLAFDVYDQYFQRIGRAKPSPDTDKRSKRVTIKDASGGKYYIMVYAPRREDAGTYRLQVKFEPQEAVAAGPTGPTDIPDPPTLPAIDTGAASGTQTAANGGTGGGTAGGTGGNGGSGTGTQTQTPVTPPPPVIQPVKARVVNYKISSGGLTITVDRGKNAGVEPGWKGQILGTSGHPVQGGDFTVTKVTGAEAVGKVTLSVDQIQANKKVVLSPP